MTLYFIIGALIATAILVAAWPIPRPDIPRAAVLALVVAALWPAAVIVGVAMLHEPIRERIERYVFTGKIR